MEKSTKVLIDKGKQKIKYRGTSFLRRIFVGFFLMALILTLAYAASFSTLTQSDFNLGTYNQTFYNTSGFVQLNASNTTGNYTSRIFDAGTTAAWNNISWTSNAIGELPANAVNETTFSNGNINMTGNVLLIHLNNDSGYGENGTRFYDFSGMGNNGTCSGTGCPVLNASGKLGKAYSFDGSDDGINVSNDASLNPSSAMTLSAWIYINSGNTNYGAILTRWGTGGNAYFIGTNPSSSQVAVYFSGSLIYTTSSFPTNQWVHLSVTHNGSTVSAYNNGVYLGGGGSGSITSSTAPSSIGYDTNRANYPFKGTIDEVAIWNRSLSAAEILNIYKRGALRLNLSVRSCSSSDCSDANFTNLGANLTSPQNLSVANNTYFQYKFEFTTDNASYTPELYNVSISYNQISTMDSYFVETYDNRTGKARSFFAPNEAIRIKTNISTGSVPTITITDSSGTVQVNAQSMSNETSVSGAWFYNYTINGSQGWYDVKINSKTWYKMFYQGNVWLGNYTDNSSNAFTFRRRINVTEPNLRNRWFEPIDILVNFTYLPNNNSVRVLEFNGTHILEIPSQIYEHNQTASGLGSSRLVFLSTINMSENRTYYVISAKANYQKNYTTDMANITTGNQSRFENSYFISFFNTSMGGLMQDVFDKLGDNASLSGTEPMDYYPEFQIGLTTYSARSDTSVNLTRVTGPVISIFNVSGQANDVDSKPYNVICKIYSKNFYMICEKNQSTTSTETWKNFYINGLISSDGKYTNASYRNSTDHIVTRAMASGDNSDTLSLDNNMKWIAFYSTSVGDGVAELFLNKSFSVTDNPAMEIVDDADNDFYRHYIIGISSVSVSSGSSFYTKTARMVYNGLQQFNIVNDTYDNLLNPLTVNQDPEQTNDNTNPRFSNTGNVSGNDTSNATIRSTWEDDSFLDYAVINITGPGANGTNTTLYYNASYAIRNSTAYVNQSDVNITLTASQINAGEIRANITVYDVSGKLNSTLIMFNVTDSTGPVFDFVNNAPSTNATLDPNATITITTNITEYTNISSVILYYRYQNATGWSAWNSTNMTNISATFYTKTYTVNFTPAYTVESNYSYYVWSNDSLGTQANSSQTNLSIYWDYTWFMSSTLTDSNGNFATNVSIGNLTINSTADFAIRLSFSAGALNDRIYFNTSSGLSYVTIDSNTLAVIPVNATARPAGQTEGVDNFTITVSNSSTSPTSNTTSFLFTTAAGGPYLYTEITQYNATVTQGDGNITLTAKVTNRGNETATNVNITFSVPTGWSASLGYSLNSSTTSMLTVGSSTTFTTHVDVSSNATTGTQTITASSTCSEGKNSTASVTVTVNALSNNPPQLDPIWNRIVDENQTLIIDINATDLENDTLRYFTNAAQVLPGNVYFNQLTGTFNWTPGYYDTGIYDVTFNVTDGEFWDSETITITVENVPYTDLVISGEDIIFSDDNPYKYDVVTITAFFSNALEIDPPSILVRFYDGAPSNNTLIGEQRIIVGERSEFFAQIEWQPQQEGEHDIYVVLDPENEIGEALENNNVAFKTIHVLTKPDIRVRDSDIGFSDNHPNQGETIEIFAMVRNIESLPTGSFTVRAYDGQWSRLVGEAQLSLGPHNTEIVRFNWTAVGGNHTIHIFADSYFVVDELLEDNNHGQKSIYVNRVPVMNSVQNQNVDENQQLLLDIDATDMDNDILIYYTDAAAVLPSGFTFDENTGLFSWIPTYNDSGQYQLKFNVTDSYAWDTEEITITVYNSNGGKSLPYEQYGASE